LSNGDAYVEYTFRDTFQVHSPQPGQIVEDDLFTVSWEEVPEADYYTVEPVMFSNPLEKSGGSFRRPIEDINGEGRFVETTAHFRISDHRNKTGGMTFEGEEWILGSGAVLGKFLPGGEYPIIVNAYDKNNQLITSSFPMRTYYDQIPSIVVEGELSKGQRLVAQMKYPEAIEHYEEVLLENPHDMEAISSLIKIYGIGWKKGEKNLERAFELLERIKDERLISDLFRSITFELEAEEILESEEQILDIIDILEKYNEDDAHYARFKYHRAKGNYEEARNALKMLQTYIPDTLIYLDIYFGDYDLAVQRLMDDRFYPSRLQGSIFRDAVLGLGENPPPAEEMDELKEFLLEMVKGGVYERRNEIYNRLVNNVDNEDILTIVDEIYNERHWNY
jgi:tetratricopeptide (TPR) repeat protein